jgi:hypothetical protein
MGEQKMQQDKSKCEADHKRFIERVVAAEAVWGLKGESGFAWCESNEAPEGDVIVFWSDKVNAECVRKSWFPEYEPVVITLFDFLFRWLPGMSSDGALAGTNWTAEMIGIESDPKKLQDEIADQMPKAMLDRYLEQIKKFIAEQATRANGEDGDTQP